MPSSKSWSCRLSKTRSDTHGLRPAHQRADARQQCDCSGADQSTLPCEASSNRTRASAKPPVACSPHHASYMASRAAAELAAIFSRYRAILGRYHMASGAVCGCVAGFFSLTPNYPINADSTPINPEFCSTPQSPEGKHYAQIHLGMFAAVLRQSKDDLDDSKAWYTKGAVLVELGRYADAGRHFIKPWSGAAEFSPCTTGHFASVRLVARNPFGANEREVLSGDPLFALRGCTACRLHIWR